MGQPAITVIKRFEYRGVDEEWSNQYHLNISAPDNATWRDWADALINLERACYSTRVHAVRAYMYDDSDNPSVYTYDLAAFGGIATGELSATTGLTAPGDAAGWVRWDTGKLSSTGKRIYLRKYLHDPHLDAEADPDNMHADWVDAYQTFGDAMLGDILTGLHMVDPEGDAPTGEALSCTYVTTRTLKRRGRRP
jgi:hypothetical protein